MTEVSPYDLAGQGAEKLAELSGVERHDVALVLGSGWLPAAEMLGETVAEIATTDLPGFSAAAVAGHSGKIRSVRVGDLRALVFLSRTHYYEGKGVAAVVHGVRTAAKAGCRTIVLTNGCGGLKETWTPGTPVLISDHINLTGRSPIVGATFVDLTEGKTFDTGVLTLRQRSSTTKKAGRQVKVASRISSRPLPVITPSSRRPRKSLRASAKNAVAVVKVAVTMPAPVPTNVCSSAERTSLPVARSVSKWVRK